MGGFFGAVSKGDCVRDLFYGTDYHSHLGTRRGGMAVAGPGGITRVIHDISNAQFRSKLQDDAARMRGVRGIGVISDYEDQPLLIRSHLGNFAIATVGVIKNIDELVARAFKGKCLHFSEMRGGEINPTELVAAIIDQKDTFEDGIRHVGEMIKGSCSILILTEDGVLAARDRYGRTPVVLARKPGAFAVSLETCAFPNLGYEVDRFLGPGEIVRITPKASRPSFRRATSSRSAPSFGSITATPPRTTKASTPRTSATVAGPYWPATKTSKSMWWPASPTRASATAWAMPRKPASPSGARSSSTRRPGPAASCLRTRMSATRWPG